ncbi:MAG: T9SS type A sorting domain-containing protein [Cyclobacteriaceae bacterium]
MKRSWLLSMLLLITVMVQAQTLEKAEYFFDDDPGVGNGAAITITPGATIDETVQVDISTLEVGFHKLNVRTYDGTSWSIAEGRTFYLQETGGGDPIAVTVDAAEYFFDKDPGVGNGTVIDLGASTNVSVTAEVTIDTLSTGFHALGIRVLDDRGVWSMAETRWFYISESKSETSATIITAAEYFIDDDPGFGLGTSIDLANDTSVYSGDFDVDLTGVAFGDHVLYVRVRDDNDVWSSVGQTSFSYVDKFNQSVDLSALNSPTYGDVIDLPAQSNANLDVTYSSSDTQVATVSDNDVTIVGIGDFEISATQAGDADYIALDQSYAVSSAKASLTATASDTSRAIGQSNPVFEIAYDGFVLDDDESDLDEVPSASTTADENSTEGFYDIVLAGGEDDHYDFTLVNGSLEILAKQTQTIDFEIDSTTYTYGDAVPAFTATATSGLDVTITSSDPAVASIDGDTVNFVGVGSVTITASQDGDADYFAADDSSYTLTVGKASLLVTASDASKTYGDPNPEFEIVYSGFKYDDDTTDISTMPYTSTDADSTSPAGTYDISITTGLADKYNFVGAGGTLTIEKASLTVIAEDTSKVYGEQNPTFSLSINGFVNGDDTDDITSPTISSEATQFSNAGSYAISVTGGSADNYEFDITEGELTVEKASLTATAIDTAKTYGEDNPVFEVSYEGFVNGEDENDITAPTVVTDATAASGVGSYDLTLTGAIADNYEISVTNGTLEVDKAILTVTIADASRSYGKSNDLTYSITGLVNGDEIADLDEAPELFSEADAASDVGTYVITMTGGSDANYVYESSGDGVLEVVQAALTATADNAVKVYGSANPAFTISYTGFVGSDDVSVLDTVSVASTIADQTSDVGTYAISVYGGSDNNYAFTEEAGVLTVSKAPLAVTADNQSRVYGEKNPELTFTYAGFVNGEDSTVLSSEVQIAVAADSTSDAGSYDIVLSGGVSDNYNFAYTNGVLTVEKASQEIDFELASEINLSAGSLQLTASATSGLAVVYELSNDEVMSIEGAVAQLLGAGFVTITASQEGNGNYQMATPVDKEIQVIDDTMNEVMGLLSTRLKVYPNPAIDQFSIDSPAELLRIYDLKGKLHKEFRNQQVFTTSDLNKGTYVVLIYQQEKIFYEKLIIDK